MNDEAVYRTAPATPGLLTTMQTMLVLMTKLLVILWDDDDYSRLWAMAREKPDLVWKDAKQVQASGPFRLTYIPVLPKDQV